MEICAECGAAVQRQQKYCRSCGSAIDQPGAERSQCSHCGHATSARERHCTQCGKPIRPERMELRASELSGSAPPQWWSGPAIAIAAGVVVCVAAAGLYLGWASRSRAAGPDTDAVRALVIAQLPAFASLDSLQLQIVEGDSGSPSNYRASFHATALPTTSLYRPAGRDNDVVFLEQVVTEGNPWPLAGTAFLQGDARRGWQGRVAFDSPLPVDVMPRDAFQGQRTIVQGSPEDVAYQEEKADEQRQAQLAAKEADERETRRRLELRQREEERLAREQAVFQLRLQQQRAAAEAAAEAAAAERARLSAAQERARLEAEVRERQQREDALKRDAERTRQQEVLISPGRIPKNKNVLVRLSTPLKTDAVSVEDQFEAITAEELVIDGRVLVPAGATLRGVVAAVESATRRNRTAKLDLAFDRLTIGSRSFPMRAKASISGRGLKGDAAKVGVGAGIGAIIGGILGGGRGAAIGGAVGGGGTLAATEGQEIDLPIGSQFQIKFDAPLDLK